MAQITQYIPMQRGAWNGTGTANTYTEFPAVSTKLNTADFDGTVSFYFEASLMNNGTAGSQTAYVQLWNHTDGAAVTGGELTTVLGTYPSRLRTAALTLSGDKVYSVRLKHSNSSGNAVLYASRIIVVQSGAVTKTQIHQEIGYEVGVTSTSATNIPSGVAQFLYEASKYDGSITVRHDATLITTASNTATAGIYDVTAASVLSGSEVTKTNDATYTIQSSGNLTLTDGHLYQPTYYVSAGASVLAESSKLVFTITGGFTKYLAYMALYSSFNHGTGSQNSTQIYPNFNNWVEYNPHFDTADFSGTTNTYYHETMMSINNSARTVYTDISVYVYAVSATPISGTEISHTGDTAISRVRSSSFSMPAGGNDLNTDVSASVGTNAAAVFNDYLILEVTGFGGGPVNGNMIAHGSWWGLTYSSAVTGRTDTLPVIGS